MKPENSILTVKHGVESIGGGWGRQFSFYSQYYGIIQIRGNIAKLSRIMCK